MEYSVRIVTSFLKDRSFQNTEFLTIWGMAGIGKTHLANYVFQLHCLDFERSCFLEDIERRCTSPNGLLDLQKQLLKDIQAGGWTDIKNLNEGTLKIEESLRKRTLLVLDGINKVEQLDVLIGTKGLHPGSKIIVTSKNKSLTEKCKLFDKEVPPKHMKHLLEGLNDEESLQLLSWHAFGRNEPNEGDRKKSMKVVKYCQGHPLALKVLGSSLHNEEDTWEGILESLGKETNPDITKILKISFDTLPYDKDKELFKHIAFFFVGEDRKFTEDILKACGVCKSTGIKSLISRCLLTVESSDILMMHQLLQDMGRDMVRQESPKKPWKRSILWHRDECLDVLQNRRGTTIIQGLVLDMRTFENETLKEPRSVDMPKFGFRSFPLLNWIHILLSVIWWLFGWISGMRSSSRKTKGDFETIALSDMLLDLSECSKLKELPRSMWKLKDLTQLLIDGCLNLRDLRSPRSSKPFVISLTRSLVRLSLKHNNLCNKSFPMDLSSLSMLEELYLDGNPIDSMPDCLRSLGRLEKLSFTDCRSLKTILCASSALKTLSIYNCCSLEKVTFHPEKSAPPRITLFDAFTMTEIQDKFKIQMLYEHGIFSTYVQGHEVPKWLTQRSSESSFTLQSSPKNGKIRGLNVCIVHTISSMKEVGPSRIKIKNLTTNLSWTYQPITYFIPEDDAFQHVMKLL
ncbi:hypothetical protein M8C21_017067 [Ambrosia artemisiifolia]|uniref:NB-ARC domain-containing protein n=1 Tax=Ambrosia artemisiifolia TaxID=4212 RepID=A0AAD5CAE3_AMBAR|nr:hypothetical protein M8C21_017067 [Ambrosia artemisiifolia]